MAPYVLLLVLAGYGFAHWDRALSLRGVSALPWVLAGWSLLHAGTLWLNAAVDRDEGEVLLGRSVPVPKGVTAWGYGALVLAVLLAWVGTPLAGAACLVCAVLAVLYSHPKTLWKGHPVFGPLVNLLGYGLLTPMVGWVAVGVPLTARGAVAWGLGASGVLGCYFLAQAFQEEEDRARGYRTLVATHGPRTVLQASRLCLAVGLMGGMALSAWGWLPRACLLGLPFGIWVDLWMRRWASAPERGSEAWARVAAWRLMITGLVGLALAFGEYARESFAGEPVAGLGTAGGHPHDRPVLPPAALAAWEREVAEQAASESRATPDSR